MRNWMLAGVLATALGGGLLSPAPAEAASRHGRHGYSHAPRYRANRGHHRSSYYRPHYRPYYRPYYRSYYRPYYEPYYAPPPVYYAPEAYSYGYGSGYCRRPSLGIGLYYGY
jgi:hypothetical protein